MKATSKKLLASNKSIVVLLVLLLFVSLFAVFLKPVFAFGVVEDSWAVKASMHVARSGLGVVAVDNKIYAIGGTGSSYHSLTDVLGVNEQYDPVSDSWVYKASMPTARAYFAVAAYQGKIYCIGGATGVYDVGYPSGFKGYTMVNVLEVYDTAADTWETKASLPVEAMQISAQAIDGKIYVMGAGSIYVYDIASNLWSNNGYMPTPRYSVVVDGKIIATGSHDMGAIPSHSLQQLMIFDPETNSVTYGSDGPIGLEGTGVGVTAGANAPQRLYVIGLKAEVAYRLSLNQVYDLKTDAWANGTAMPTSEKILG